MIRNIGNTDRIMRIVIAIILAILVATGNVNDQWRITIVVIAAVMLFTAIAGFCPLYRVFGVSTCKRVQS